MCVCWMMVAPLVVAVKVSAVNSLAVDVSLTGREWLKTNQSIGKAQRTTKSETHHNLYNKPYFMTEYW